MGVWQLASNEITEKFERRVNHRRFCWRAHDCLEDYTIGLSSSKFSTIIPVRCSPNTEKSVIGLKNVTQADAQVKVVVEIHAPIKVQLA